MLDLRGLYFEPSERAETGESSVNGHGFSDIHFTTSGVVGNLGAPLDPTMSVSSEHSFSTSDADDGPASPYDDEKPKYTSDPFQEGMKFSLALDMDGPRLTAMEMQVIEESPISPVSVQCFLITSVSVCSYPAIAVQPGLVPCLKNRSDSVQQMYLRL